MIGAASSGRTLATLTRRCRPAEDRGWGRNLAGGGRSVSKWRWGKMRRHASLLLVAGIWNLLQAPNACKRFHILRILPHLHFETLCPPPAKCWPHPRRVGAAAGELQACGRAARPRSVGVMRHIECHIGLCALGWAAFDAQVPRVGLSFMPK